MEAESAAELVADDEYPLEREGVEQREEILDERGGAVAVPGSVRPAEAAQVGADEAMVRGEEWDNPALGVPVLGPAM